ncbi:Villin-3 [Sesamum angolense]|uniref:Villin-3 n=1 Tax=Sesamum angolense TaxID=2727404 RepID=A0AAE1WFH8_9LAMI|nr:Villin-3 [Sesamum angolense]
MSSSAKALEPAFQGAGQRVGTEIWRIENFQPVPLPKSDYGKFYSGDSYIILQTITGKGGSYLYDIHFWLGKDTSQDEAGTAAIKTVELDAVLGGRAVQYREPQGHESEKFLSYFKPCIIPLEGGIASGFKKPEEEEFETRLYICRGKRVVKLKQVPFSRSSLNHDDVFILDTKDKIYQFNGANSNIQERAKALEVIQFLKEKYHEGKCDVAIVDDGKLQAESDSGEFWVLFGGFAPIGKKVATEDDIIPEKTPPQLYCIIGGEVKNVDGELSKSILENNKCYLLDCGAEVFVWVGRVTQVDERKAASQVAEVATSLNSNECFLLQSGSSIFSWQGNQSSFEQQQLAAKVAEFLKERSNGSNNGGPTQRASALAALNSAFNSTPSTKAVSAPKPGGTSQGSQRAAAVAALSSVLTAEKKPSPGDVSPVRRSGSPSAESSPPAPGKSEEAAEIEDSEEVSEVKETETVEEPIPESNEDDSGPKSDTRPG